MEDTNMIPTNFCELHHQFMDIDYTKNPPELFCLKCHNEKDEVIRNPKGFERGLNGKWKTL